MEDRLPVAAEGNYAVVGMADEGTLIPHASTLANLSRAAGHIGAKWDFVWDLREVTDRLYEDVRAAFTEMELLHADRKGGTRSSILCSPHNVQLIADALRIPQARLTVVRSKPIAGRPLPLLPFSEDDHQDLVSDAAIAQTSLEFLSSQAASQLLEEEQRFSSDKAIHQLIDRTHPYEEFDAFDEGYRLDKYELDLNELEVDWNEPEFDDTSAEPLDETYARLFEEMETQRAALLDRFLVESHVTPRMTEVGLFFDGRRFSAAAYHANATFGVEVGSELVQVRPGSLFLPRSNEFRSAIRELEFLLNFGTNEAQLEDLLKRHPLFLRGLNYRSVYHQVVLPRSDGKSLRPDIIAEPFDSDWADIVELKRADSPVLVGKNDRRALASAITSAPAQLREYSNWFDDRRAAENVERKYGFKCYKPRLMVIIGRDPTSFTTDEARRAMTAHSGLEVVTYDGLLRAARNHLLI